MVDWSARAVGQSHRLYPYVPGKPIEQLLAEKGLSEAIKLASNENPCGPAPSAIAVLKQTAEFVHRYPDGDAGDLKQALADKHHVKSGNVLVGNGSNEVLELVIRTFAGPSDEVVFFRAWVHRVCTGSDSSGGDGHTCA